MKLSELRKMLERVDATVVETVRCKGGLRVNTIKRGKKRTTMKTFKVNADEVRQ